MNRQQSIIALLAAPLLLLTACSSDDTATVAPDGPAPILLGTSIAPTTRANSELQATELSAANTDGVGTFIYRNTKTAIDNEYGYENVKYTITGTAGDLTLASGETQPYYPMQKTSVDVYGYAPYLAVTATGTDPKYKFTGCTVKNDQSTDLGYMQSDFVSGVLSNLTYANRTQMNVIPLNHRLCKIIVKLTAVGTLTMLPTNLMGAQITLHNIKTKFDFNPVATDASGDPIVSNVVADGTNTDINMGTTGTVTVADASSLTTDEKNEVDKALTLYAVIPPQTLTGFDASPLDLFTVTLNSANNSAVYNLATKGTQQFEAGKQYTYTITVDATKLSFTTTITDWTKDAADQGHTGTAK